MKKKKKILVVLAITLFVAGCSSQLYMPSSAAGGKQSELMQGRKLYVNHCASCHNLHLPKEYTAAQWQKNVDEMQYKAKITDAEKQLILAYLTYKKE